ncbi:MAG: hypothetical protein RIC18_06075 [Hoeflea sp.]|uniref:hypothetical protein n=1 Tax=Hoeflea sp. TaxID=1940281 RepID=UPI0032ECB61C
MSLPVIVNTGMNGVIAQHPQMARIATGFAIERPGGRGANSTRAESSLEEELEGAARAGLPAPAVSSRLRTSFAAALESGADMWDILAIAAASGRDR